MTETLSATPRSQAGPAVASNGSGPLQRVSVRGKYLFAGSEKFHLRGVTYGPFAPTEASYGGFSPEVADADFAAMAASGINAVRVYTVPPRWLLDAALRHGLRVMVGISWEQHVTFLDDRRRARVVERRVRAGVRACAGHPAVLCYAVGNEIPTPIARWHGRRRVERFIARLYRAAKEEDPDGLVTYVNYPSTEYLQLPFLDLACFNVYLEEPGQFEAYVARLQNVVGDLPLVLAEVGLDSRRNGHHGQAGSLEWQLQMAFAGGCSGSFAFAWTDEWHRGGYEIEDWDFGLTARDRAPKPALDAVRRVYSRVPFPHDAPEPRISVVICTRNGARTLRDCLRAVDQLDYEDYEVIVVADGSTDATAAIAREYKVELVETPARGLASARNTGLSRASGEVVAYLDDDACPDPDWLRYLADAFARTRFVGIGGPNVPPPGEGQVAQCVAHAPGGPTHVLLSDREAEHIPGCNMAFRRDALEAIGGFDPRFHAAGDDVDVCWRLQERGWRLGFSPGAVVWHRRRDTIRGYFRQQRGYGAAEALLERKWPEKYSPGGHVNWHGRLYGNGAAQHRGGRRWRIYYGGWGTGLFQSIYGPRRGLLESLPLMPEWYLAIAVLTALSAAGALWEPLLLALPVLAGAVGVLFFDAVLGATRASFRNTPRAFGRLRLRVLSGVLYLLQPLARLYGRLIHGLTPWRRRGPRAFRIPVPWRVAFWSERWKTAEERVTEINEALRSDGSVVLSGGDWDRWDLQIRGGALGVARLRVAIEEHGAGKQLIRVRSWPFVQRVGVLIGGLSSTLAIAALASGAAGATALFGAVTLLIALRLVYECGAAAATAGRVLRTPVPGSDRLPLGSELPAEG